jgi:hypothetical protein
MELDLSENETVNETVEVDYEYSYDMNVSTNLYNNKKTFPTSAPYHRYITSRSNMSISADVHPWGAISLLTAPPQPPVVQNHTRSSCHPPLRLSHISLYLPAHPSLPE